MAIVFLLGQFPARDEHIVAAGGDDVIPAVGRRVPDRFVLAHEQDRDAGGEAAQRRGLGRGEGDVVPASGVGEAGSAYGLRHCSCE